MLCGIFRSTVLVRIAALIVAVTSAAVACGAQEEGGGANLQPRYASARGCSPTARQRRRASLPGSRSWPRERASSDRTTRTTTSCSLRQTRRRASSTRCPRTSAGGVVIDSVRDRVIVQVTSGEDEVLAHIREHVEEPGRITAETVRWSGEDLATFAHRLETIRSSDSWGYGLDNANGRTEVDVPGDAGAARRKISEVIYPCAFKVRATYRPCDPTDAGPNT